MLQLWRRVAAILLLSPLVLLLTRWGRLWTDARNYWAGDMVDFTYADNVTGFEQSVVPNVVHFVIMGGAPLGFVTMVCIRAAWIQQRPDRLWIHCDMCEAVSRSTYWSMVKDIPGLELRKINRPRWIFGRKLSSVYHASDVARLNILREHGGIFLDNDSYLVKSLEPFRHFEMTLGWPPGQSLGTQVLVAHRNARFLQLWYQSYRYYKPERWYWNAGELPTQMFLIPKPHLVHRVTRDFGVQMVTHMLYRVCSDEWLQMYAVHLLHRHRDYLAPNDTVGEYDERNIVHYNKTFGQMARLVVYGTTRLGATGVKDVRWFLRNGPRYAPRGCGP